MTTIICFDSDEEIALLYNSTTNKFIYITDDLRSFNKEKPLDVAAFRQKARNFTFYKSISEDEEPLEIDRRLGYSYLGLRIY